MKQNGRLSLAFHALAHMAFEPERPMTSTEIAQHIGTNPVVVRRVLGKLREEGLLVSEKGHAGGWRFANDPKQITLADIYKMFDERLIGESKAISPCSCPIERNLHQKISGILDELEQEFILKLSDIPLSRLEKV